MHCEVFQIQTQGRHADGLRDLRRKRPSRFVHLATLQQIESCIGLCVSYTQTTAFFKKKLNLLLLQRGGSVAELFSQLNSQPMD